MALEALANPIPGVVSTRRLEGSLVAPRTQVYVPNHLADTKIFSKVKQNGLLQTKPAVIHFDGYRVGQLHQQTLRIVNVSKENQQMHVIAPTTPFFSIKYSKQRSSLVPGLSLDVTVQFRPTKWKYYYDCIRIHCKGDHNLLVPIHAYPVMNTAKFPHNVKFPSIPVGQQARKTLSLECDVPIDFEYQLTYHQQHPAFTVSPMKGVVPANGKVSIKVTFAPTEFSTATMTLQLEVSQFNSSPVICTFTGSSTPGLAVEKLKDRSGPIPRSLKPRPIHAKSCITSVKKNSRKFPSNATLPRTTEEDIVYEGIHFPADLNNPSAVSKVLAQQPGKMKATQLRQAASQTGPGVASQQVKEAVFLQQVKDTAAEERANQLRWVTNLGSVAMSSREKTAVLHTRVEASREYQRHCHVAEMDKEALRSSTECVYRRTRRQVGELPDYVPTFDPYCNDTWQRRHTALQRFVQAARRVVVRLRCRHRVARLQKLRSHLSSGKSLEESLVDMSSKCSGVTHDVCSKLPSTAAHILPFSFPKYQQRELTQQASAVEVQATEVDVRKEVAYMNLKVPQQYKLAGYSPHPLPTRGLQSYLPPGLSRELRTGAEDELRDLGSIPGVDLDFIISAPSPLHVVSPLSPSSSSSAAEVTKATEMMELAVQDVEGVRGEGGGGEKGELVFVPPSALYKPTPRHPLHIFNPSPGVSSYAPMLPHSEVSMDHSLLPLPTYPTSVHPSVRPDPIDVIPGVMQWKSFPSHCLVSLESSKKLVTVWRPRWNDPFSTDLLPQPNTHTQLMTGPQPDDKELLDDDNNGELLPVPTMDMVRAQFYIPADGDGKDEKVLASRKLEEDQSNEFNQLGRRMSQRLDTLLTALGDTRARTEDDHS